MREYRLFIEDILICIEKILKYTKDLSYEEFLADEILIDAVIRNFEIIGEAAGKIPNTIKERNPEIPWTILVAVRNVMIHEYFGIDLHIIWNIILKNLPSLKTQIRNLLNEIK